MSNDIRDYPARARSSDGLYRFLGGSPLSVAFRLVLLSILVGVVLSAIGSTSSTASGCCSSGSMSSASTPSTGCGATSCSAR